MNGNLFAAKKYPEYPSYQKIAAEAFDAGIIEGKTQNKTAEKYEAQIKKLKAELKEIKQIINDPEQFADYIAGM